MDPNANLTEQRTLVRAIQSIMRDLDNAPTGPRRHGLLEELAERANDLSLYTDSLDFWLTTGGFLPQPWQRQGDDNQ